MHLRKTFSVLLILSFSLAFSQIPNEKVKLVFVEKALYRKYSGGPAYSGYSEHGASRSTHTFIYFTVGNGPQQKIGWRARKLVAVLKKDDTAYRQFLIYRRTVKKKAVFKATRVGSEIITTAGAILVFAGLASDNKNPGLIITGSAGAIAGIAGGLLSVAMEIKLNKRAVQELKESVDTYNAHLANKTDSNPKD